jgi:hypothetical protein
MAAYVPTVWVNDTTPALTAANLNKLTTEFAAQATAKGIANTLPTWADGVAPALTESAPLNEMERIARQVALAVGLSYISTVWDIGWTPARNATRLNRLEEQARLNRIVIDGASQYPATYLIGPLGAGVPLPTYGKKFLLGWWGKNPDGSTSLSEWQTGVSARETAMGRKYNGLHMGHGGAGSDLGGPGCFSYGFGAAGYNWINSHGALPITSWSPNGYGILDYAAGDSAAMSCLNAVIDWFKQFPFTIMLRWWWEYNQAYDTTPYDPWGHGSNPNPADFISAWRRVVEQFASRGATNVGFWWNPLDRAGGNARILTDQSYPGDAYVDWAGVECYNACTWAGGGGCTPLHNGWASIAEILDYHISGGNNPSMYQAYSPRKPFGTGEGACVFDPAAPSTAKGDWFRNGISSIGNMSLVGWSIYDIDISALPGEHNYKVDDPISNPDTYNGWKSLAASSIWQPGPA